ncbi:hypothetical protein ACVCL0_00760 [Rhodanobacter sp. UC4450_H17]
MTEINARRLSKLVPLLDEVSPAEMRSTLPALVHDGEVELYVRVPAGKAVYMDGIQLLPTTFSDAANSLSRPLSPYDRSQMRNARKSGIPAIQAPMIVPGAIYLGMAPKDARLLLEMERRDVCWFPCAVLFSQDSGTDSKHLTRVIPWQSLCCLRPDDGQPKRGPWIGPDPGHALAIELRDVLVEQNALDIVLRTKEDPLGLRETSPGVYVLCRAAAHFNDPEKGVQARQPAVEEWARNEASACGVDDWLFTKGVLKQVRKLINTKHNERQGMKSPTEFDLSVLNDDEARAFGQLHWASKRLMLVVHAARCWQQLICGQERPWEAVSPDDQMRMTRNLGKRLDDWGFTGDGERDAVLSVAIYPIDIRDIRLKQRAKQKAMQKTRS